MKKAELIEALEGASGQSKAAVTAVLDALPGVLIGALRDHKALTVPGVGKFEAKDRKSTRLNSSH